MSAVTILSMCIVLLLGFYVSKYQENKANEEKVEFWKKRFFDEQEKTTSLRFLIDMLNEHKEKQKE